MDNYPLAKRENIVVREGADELMIYDLSINKGFAVNRPSALIWDLCDGKHSVGDIAEAVTQTLGSEVDVEYIWLALDKLNSLGLLENSGKFAGLENSLSRRDLLKRVAMASLVALPLVSVFVTPAKAAMSCYGANNNVNANDDGCICSHNDDCKGDCSPRARCRNGNGQCADFVNNVGASPPGCPCQSNLDCNTGLCSFFTHVCLQP